MPRRTRPRREPTDDDQPLSLWANRPKHRTFELIRPVVLFGQSPAERARETGAAERQLIVDLKREYLPLHPKELATICYLASS